MKHLLRLNTEVTESRPAANEKFLIQNIGILSVNDINFDCRHGKVTLSHNLAVPGITVSGVTYTAKYLSSEGMYVLGSLA